MKTKDAMGLADLGRYWQVHRPDLQRALFERAQELGVKIHVATRVVDLNPQTGEVVLANGRTIASDLIICADGKCPLSI